MSLADDRAICEAATRDLSHEPQAKFDQRFTPWHVSKLLDVVEAAEAYHPRCPLEVCPLRDALAALKAVDDA